MDTTLIVIIAVIVLIIIALLFVVFSGSGKKPDNTGNNKNEAQDITSKRLQQAFSNDSLQSEMEAEAKEAGNDILTKYTSGTGEGISEVEKLLEGDPNNVELLDWLAFMYYSNEKIDKAIETYRRALSIKSDNENQHYYLANSYFKKGMMTEAKNSWNEVIRLNPNSKIARKAQERIDFLNSHGK